MCYKHVSCQSTYNVLYMYGEYRSISINIPVFMSKPIIIMFRSLILLAEVYSDLGHPALALPHVMDCLTLCETNHLPSQRAKLCLAQLQVQCIGEEHL